MIACLLGRHAWAITRVTPPTITERCARRGCRGRTERVRGIFA